MIFTLISAKFQLFTQFQSYNGQSFDGQGKINFARHDQSINGSVALKKEKTMTSPLLCFVGWDDIQYIQTVGLQLCLGEQEDIFGPN